MRDTFESYHPTVNLLYFILVISFSMILTHPAASLPAFVCALAYTVQVHGKRCVPFLLKFCLPAVLLVLLFNPIFNHEGTTILLFVGDGTPLTLESILYGAFSGLMLVTVLLHFSSLSRVMTTDKFIYLFGRLIPALSLVLSMSLRFVPKFRRQTEAVIEAQRCIGRDIAVGSLWQRFKTAATVLSILITWALENAIETADSMKSRGYGLRGRTAFSIYRMDERDKYALGWLAFCALFLAAGVFLGVFDFRYFPSFRYTAFELGMLPFYTVYFGLCLTPVILNFAKERQWKTICSNM